MELHHKILPLCAETDLLPPYCNADVVEGLCSGFILIGIVCVAQAFSSIEMAVGFVPLALREEDVVSESFKGTRCELSHVLSFSLHGGCVGGGVWWNLCWFWSGCCRLVIWRKWEKNKNIFMFQVVVVVVHPVCVWRTKRNSNNRSLCDLLARCIFTFVYICT